MCVNVIVQPCVTAIVANVIKIVYHALTCTNELVVKMKVNMKIMNLFKTMNIISPRKYASKIYLLFVCFKNRFNIIILTKY